MIDNTFLKLQKIALEFTNNRNWQKYHNPKNISMAIAIEAAELMELFQWKSTEDCEDKDKLFPMMSNIRDEVADILIYILHLANNLELDLEQIVLRKLAHNNTRTWQQFE